MEWLAHIPSKALDYGLLADKDRLPAIRARGFPQQRKRQQQQAKMPAVVLSTPNVLCQLDSLRGAVTT